MIFIYDSLSATPDISRKVCAGNGKVTTKPCGPKSSPWTVKEMAFLCVQGLGRGREDSPSVVSWPLRSPSSVPRAQLCPS